MDSMYMRSAFWSKVFALNLLDVENNLDNVTFYFRHGKVYARHVGLITTKHLGTFKSVVFTFCNAFLQCKKHEQQWQGFLWPPISKSLCCILVYFLSVPGDGWVAVVTAIVMVKTCVLLVLKKKKDTSWYPALTPSWMRLFFCAALFKSPRVGGALCSLPR